MKTKGSVRFYVCDTCEELMWDSDTVLLSVYPIRSINTYKHTVQNVVDMAV